MQYFLSIPSRHQRTFRSAKDRNNHLPTILPQNENFESSEPMNAASPVKSMKRILAMALVAISCVVLGLFSAYWFMSITDVNAIQGQYIIELDRKHYTNDSVVVNFIQSIDQVASTSGGDFVLLQQYSNLNRLGLLGISVKMSDSMHSTLLQTDGVLSIEPDLRVQVRFSRGGTESFSALSSSEEGDSCQLQSNPKW
jgi:hypothetical protein